MAKQKPTKVLSSLPILCNTTALLLQGPGGGTTPGMRILRRWFGGAEDGRARRAGQNWLAAAKRSAMFRRTVRLACELRNISPHGPALDFAVELLDALAILGRSDRRHADISKVPSSAILEELIRQRLTCRAENAALRRIVAEAVKRFDFQEGSLLLFDEIKEDLFFHLSVSPVADRLLGLRVPIANSIAGSILRTGQPAYVADVLESGQHYGDIDSKTGVRTESILGAPLRCGDRLLGVIELVNRNTPKPCGQDDIEAFMRVAQKAQARVEGIRIHQSICDIFRQCISRTLWVKGITTLEGLSKVARRWQIPDDVRRAFQAAVAVHRVAISGEVVPGMGLGLLRSLRRASASSGMGISFSQFESLYGKKT